MVSSNNFPNEIISFLSAHYHFYIFLVTGTILLTDLFWASLPNTEEDSVTCHIAVWCRLICGVVIVHRMHPSKQHTIKSFFTHRYTVPFAVIGWNVLLPVHLIGEYFSGWVNAIFFILITIIAFSSFITMFDQNNELESPIYYWLVKTTKTTRSQKIFMAIFFTITEVFYIGFCFIDLPYKSFGYPSETRFICPIINILAIPIVYVAFFAANSDKLEFTEEGENNVQLRKGVCNWNRETGKWDLVEDGGV